MTPKAKPLTAMARAATRNPIKTTATNGMTNSQAGPPLSGPTDRNMAVEMA